MPRPWLTRQRQQKLVTYHRQKDGTDNQMKGGKDMKYEIKYETCEENSMLITHFVHGLLVYNNHVSGDLADVELLSFIKTDSYWVMQRHTTRQNRYCNPYRWKKNTQTFKFTIRCTIDEVSMVVTITVVANWLTTLCRLVGG